MTSKQIQELMQEVEKNPWAGPSANDLVSLCQTALDALQRVEEMGKTLRELRYKRIVDFLECESHSMNPDNFSNLCDTLSLECPDAVKDWQASHTFSPSNL